MKLEIYQVGKVPPLTVVECDGWTLTNEQNHCWLKCFKKTPDVLGPHKTEEIAIFNFNNIAGFKEVSEDSA